MIKTKQKPDYSKKIPTKKPVETKNTSMSEKEIDDDKKKCFFSANKLIPIIYNIVPENPNLTMKSMRHPSITFLFDPERDEYPNKPYHIDGDPKM